MMLQASLSPSSVQRAKGPSGPAPGDYWVQDTYQADIGSAIPTGLLIDGSAGNQSTFVESSINGLGGQEYITLFRVWATPQALNSVSVRALIGESVFSWIVERWTGSAWSNDFNVGMGATPANFQPTWSTLTQSLNASLTTTMIRVSILSMTDAGGGDGPVIRVGDMRTS